MSVNRRQRTETGIRTPDGKIHWNKYVLPSNGTHYDLPRDLSRLAAGVREFATKYHLEPNLLLGEYRVMRREVVVSYSDEEPFGTLEGL